MSTPDSAYPFTRSPSSHTLLFLREAPDEDDEEDEDEEEPGKEDDEDDQDEGDGYSE
jgi:hypothetical protein